MHTLYNFFLRLVAGLLLPVWLPVTALVPGWRRGLGERLGFFTHARREAFKDLPRPRVWFHAASLGELSAVAPIAQLYKERHPETAVLVSTMTLAGLDQALNKIPCASMAFLVPLDFPGAVRRVMRVIEPNLLAIAETELWPNLVREAKRAGSQVALINGRLSERSQRRYQRVRSLVRPLLERFDVLAIQSEKDAERFRLLGANPQRVKITGNVKFNMAGSPVQQIEALRSALRLHSGQPVWVAGSTRPGEEPVVLDAFAQVHAQVPGAVLILAPRHLERLTEVERLLVERRLSFTRRSHVDHELLDFPVILLDTLGELSTLYGVGQVAFVGGSLAPFGGHNPLEPAVLGIPVLIGPHMDHFSRTSELLLAGGGAQTVASAAELAQAVIRLLTQPDEARRMGHRAQKTLEAYQGAAGQTVDLLQKLMLIRRWGKEVKKWREESVQTALGHQPREREPHWPEW